MEPYDINRGGPVTDWKGDVGPGWHRLIDELHGELEAASPGYRTEQLKEKFAALTVYISPWSEEIRDILERYYQKSRHVCEECGASGEIRTSRFWLKTLCDEHEAARGTMRQKEG